MRKYPGQYSYKKTGLDVPNNFLKACACGCGEQLWNFIRYDNGHITERKYIIHHGYNRGRITFDPNSMVKTARASRRRAMKILRLLGKNTCEINNKDCSHKKLESHHIDGDPFNNDISNLVPLCIVHHQIIERKKITIDELRGLQLIYYVSSNKRRYIR